MIEVNSDLQKLVPGIGTPGFKTCGFQPGEPACTLALLNRRPGEKIQLYACGFGTGSRDCSEARARFTERYGQN